MSPKIRVAISLMRENLNRPLKVADLARSLRLSHSRLSHLFKTEVGLSPAQYLKRIRMEKACRLLEVSFLRVKEIAAAVGYNDPTHFERDFKKTYGQTPLRHRAEYLSATVKDKSA